MIFRNGLGEMAIQDVIVQHPTVGEILSRHDIGCVTCRVGICLLKDVVSIHGLTPEQEATIEAELNGYLDGTAA